MRMIFLAGCLVAALICQADELHFEAAQDAATLRHFKAVPWPRAYREQDVELLGQMLHERFEMLDNDGERSIRADELARVAANAWDPGSFEYRIERLDIFDGRVAVIAGTGVAAAYTYKSSNVLIKEDGDWRAIASHVSGYRRTE